MASPPYNICCPVSVIAGHQITKQNRQEAFGQVAGGGGSTKPEKQQRKMIEEGTGTPCEKSNMRINHETLVMRENSRPMTYDSGFDWTENFDGVQKFDDKLVYINLKSVVGTGGSQTRTLRDECYPFVRAQLKHLNQTKKDTTYFANIFDGDEAADCMIHFTYLLNRPAYADIKKYVYVGDLKGYFDWLKTILC
jgi:hypothetical protein